MADPISSHSVVPRIGHIRNAHSPFAHDAGVRLADDEEEMASSLVGHWARSWSSELVARREVPSQR